MDGFKQPEDGVDGPMGRTGDGDEDEVRLVVVLFDGPAIDEAVVTIVVMVVDPEVRLPLAPPFA